MGHGLLEHLMVRYGRIIKPIIGQAKTEFRDYYDPIFLTSKSFKRIEDAMQLASDMKLTWQTEQIIQQRYIQMKKCGTYKYECKEWMKKYGLANIWDNLTTNFT